MKWHVVDLRAKAVIYAAVRYDHARARYDRERGPVDERGRYPATKDRPVALIRASDAELAITIAGEALARSYQPSLAN